MDRDKDTIDMWRGDDIPMPTLDDQKLVKLLAQAKITGNLARDLVPESGEAADQIRKAKQNAAYQAKFRAEKAEADRLKAEADAKRVAELEAQLAAATAAVPKNPVLEAQLAALAEQNKVLSATITQLMAAPLTPPLPVAPAQAPEQQAEPMKPEPMPTIEPEAETPPAKPSPLALVVAAIASWWHRFRY